MNTFQVVNYIGQIRIVFNVVDHLKCVHVIPDDDQKMVETCT
jgi:hypothetical protein